MKKCIRCNEDKNDKEYYQKKSGNKQFYTECKICMNTRTTARMYIFKQKAVEYKGGECEKCGYKSNIKSLDFHHKDPAQKDFGITAVKTSNFDDKITSELDKCELLCSNCHRETHDELWRYNSPLINWELYDELLQKWIEPKEKVIHNCKDCNTQLKYKTKKCKTCYAKSQEKITWPDDNVLLAMIKKSNYSTVSRELGISDNAIRHRLKVRKLI